MKRGLSSVLNSRAKSMASEITTFHCSGDSVISCGETQDGTVQDRLAVEWPVGAQRIEFIIQRSTAFPCPQREIDALGSVGFGGRTAFQRRGQTFGRWIAATIQDVQGLEGRPAPVFGHSHRNAPMVDKTPVTATMAS